MCDSTYVLRRWHHHDWPSNTLSLTEQALENSFSDMNLNSISALYADFRSPSRSAQRDLWRRKKQRILNPMSRTKHCAYHRNCLAFSNPHISSRQCRWRSVRAECTSEAYWDRECAEHDVRERVESADLVKLYYNHGHNAAVIESLHPQPLESAQSEEGDEDGNVDEWVSIPRTADTASDSKSASDLHPEAEPEIKTTQNWTLYLHTPFPAPVGSPQPSRFTRSCDDTPETTFTFHRNATGIWELGFANPDSSSPSADPHGCTQLPLPLSCDCCSANAGCFACSCADFPPDWRSPDEPWRGNLIAWADGDVVQRMQLVDSLHAVQARSFLLTWRGGAGQGVGDGVVKHGGSEEWTFVRAPRGNGGGQDEGWDVVSELSSTGSWRVVDVA